LKRSLAAIEGLETSYAARSRGALGPTTLVARLKKAGEAEVLGAEQAEIDSYFDAKHFRFHAPDGFEPDFAGLNDYFKTIRPAFDDRSIRRGLTVVQGSAVARPY
jgi:hypothetical protein